MEEKITTKTAERKNAETGGEESTGDVQRHIAQLKDDLRKILETVESINSYVRSGADRERGVASENLNKLQSRRRTLEETDARLIQESADLEGSLRQIKDVERDVSLFLRFAHTQRDVVGLRAELEQLRRDGQRYGPAENLEAEKAQLSAQKRDLENKVCQKNWCSFTFISFLFCFFLVFRKQPMKEASRSCAETSRHASANCWNHPMRHWTKIFTGSS